jgi:hypothetical protein
MDPAHTDAISLLPLLDVGPQLLDVSDHFMAKDDGKMRWRSPTLNLVQFRVTDPTRRNTNQDLARSRLRNRQIHHS